ncbi:hypothetical protein BDV33DRAFT_179496 [Aspergillus novoparasiticus]|uniref:Uncharacterized protein n=1 Tax=Aspergillus novoparasiticus TaxID=986946 RepID=A0A5N6EEX1_9EURO|nr:hypothetical protein BDV33DRAFT_179496 [Aspergillus novoparasiticus]
MGSGKARKHYLRYLTIYCLVRSGSTLVFYLAFERLGCLLARYRRWCTQSLIWNKP